MKSITVIQKVLSAALISMLLAPSVSLAFSTSATSGSSATGWTNSGNVFTSNDVRATSNISTTNGVTPALNVTGFSFVSPAAIPTNAVIKGITASIEHSHNGSNLTVLDDNSVRLLKAGSAVGTNKATGTTWPDTTDSTASYGGASDLWGTTWTASEINASNFGIAISADCATCGIIARDARIDWVTLTVNYTLPQTITPAVIPAKTYGDADFSPAYTGGLSGNTVTYSSTTPAVCTVVANQIHIVGAGSCTFNANQAGNSDYEAATQVPTTITIAQKPLTVTGVTAVDKIYDNTNVATLAIGGAVVSGRAGTDTAAEVNITLTGAAATFSNEHAGAGKAVTIASLGLTGTKAASYTLPAANINGGTGTTASIAARPLTVAAQTDTKTYDGNTTSATAPLVTVGTVQAGDTAAFTQAFDTPAASVVAGDKTLTATGVVNDGNSGNDYTYTFTTATGTINKKTITEASFTNPETEVYDPTNAREFNGSTAVSNADVKIKSTDVVSGDDVVFAPLSASFVTSTVGTGKPVNITINPAFTGAAAGNYVLGPDGGDGYSAITSATITDTTAPTVTITSGPADGSAQATDSATFEFTVADAASGIATTECKLDAGAYTACTSPVAYTGLSSSTHSFSVRATDTSTVPSANTSVAVTPTSQRTFTVDTVAPTLVSITTTATNPTNLNPIPFVVTFSEAVSGLDFPLDFSIGNGSVTSITPAGPSSVYTVNVEPSPTNSPGVLVTFAFDAGATIVDAVGNAFAGSASTLSRTYDGAAPTLTKTAGPDDAGYWNSSTAVFNFTAPGATFECEVDGGGFAPCTDSNGSHTISGMADGSVHVFKVKATDAATNSTTLTITFTVDLTPPTVVLTTPPPVFPLYTNVSPITVTATFSEPVTGVDIGDFVVTNGTVSNFVASSSTVYYVDVTPTADGLVTVNLPASAAVDIAANPNSAATQKDINYDATAPTLVFATEPAALTNDNTLDFTYTADDLTSGVSTCAISVDATPDVPSCSSFTSAALGDGPHIVVFTITDNAGNVLTVTKNITVDTVAPLLFETSPVPTPTFPSDARPYTYESSEAGTAVLGGSCSGSGAAIMGPNPITLGTLSAGTYNCTIVVTDAAGNASLPLTMTPFEVKNAPSNGPVTSGGASFPVAGNIQQGGANGPTQGTTGIAVNIPTPSSPQDGNSSTGGTGVAVTSQGTLATNEPGTPAGTGTGQSAGGNTGSTPKVEVKTASKGAPQTIVKSKPKPLAKAPAKPKPVEKAPTAPTTQTASASDASQGFWSWIKGLIFGN